MLEDLDVFTCTLLSMFVSVFTLGIGLSFSLCCVSSSLAISVTLAAQKHADTFLPFVFYKMIWES